MAARNLSRASCTAASGNPTVKNQGVRSSRQPICSPPTAPSMAVILPSLVPIAVSLATYVPLPFHVLPGMGETAAGVIDKALRYSPVAVIGLRPQNWSLRIFVRFAATSQVAGPGDKTRDTVIFRNMQKPLGMR